MIWCVEDDASIRDIELYALTSTGFEARGFDVLKSADRSLQFFKTRLCFCVIIGGTHRFNVLAHRRAEIPAALFFIQ